MQLRDDTLVVLPLFVCPAWARSNGCKSLTRHNSGKYTADGKCRLGIHAKTKAKLKSHIKKLTSRSNGMGYEQRKSALTMYMRGWMEYYKLADGKNFLQGVDEWYRRRLRMCIWKCWKRVKTRFKNLMRCGISRNQAWQWANTRQGYWHIAHSWILTRAISNEKLQQAGYPSLMGYYKQLHIQ